MLTAPSHESKKSHPTNEGSEYVTKLSEGEAKVQELWRVLSIILLQLLPSPSRLGEVAPVSFSFTAYQPLKFI